MRKQDKKTGKKEVAGQPAAGKKTSQKKQSFFTILPDDVIMAKFADFSAKRLNVKASITFEECEKSVLHFQGFLPSSNAHFTLTSKMENATLVLTVGTIAKGMGRMVVRRGQEDLPFSIPAGCNRIEVMHKNEIIMRQTVSIASQNATCR